VIGAYAPTNDTASAGKDKFWDTLRGILEEIPRRKEIIIMRDMNARVVCGNKSKAVGKFGEEIKNDNCDRLTSICEQFELKMYKSFLSIDIYIGICGPKKKQRNKVYN
jgi:hypothetical protein